LLVCSFATTTPLAENCTCSCANTCTRHLHPAPAPAATCCLHTCTRTSGHPYLPAPISVANTCDALLDACLNILSHVRIGVSHQRWPATLSGQSVARCV
jgi:hypothetical protein